jgi:predicted dehydrogenase/threonine dehydrogenase-like Zn-dependent dehydrogenase
MKQIARNLKRGQITLEEVPLPSCKANGVVIKTHYSAVSIGTERMEVKNAEMNYLQMAKSKPDQAKQVLNTVAKFGPKATYRIVMNKLDSLIPMGYSCCGEVIETGSNIRDLVVGDFVACGGVGYASHSEYNYVPRNLCAKIPDGVSLKEASFTTIASIAMHAFRRSNVQIGDNVAVIGLGLLGQILIQIIKANGCNPFGFDIDSSKCVLAKENGASYTAIATDENIESVISPLTNGHGCDAVIVTTATKDNAPIVLAGSIARDKANIVDVGITKMDIPWSLYYHKELNLIMSRSYGPGRYDSNYEEDGIDYPIGHIKWTENRNMISILNLLEQNKISFKPLISQQYNFEEAVNVYPELSKGGNSNLGIVWKFNPVGQKNDTVYLDQNKKETTNSVMLGAIGMGNYSSTMLFPFISSNKDTQFIGVATTKGITAYDKAKSFKFDYATTDYKKLLNDKKINTLFITTRHNLHGKFVVESLNHNKHTFVEKPLALNEDELIDISQSFTKSKAANQIMVGYNRRFSPSIRHLKAQLRKDFPYTIHYNINSGFLPNDNWYQHPTQGGRIIGECGHFIDTLQYLLDAHPISVFASSTNVSDMPNQDNLNVIIKFSNQSSCVLSYLSDGSDKYPKEKISIVGGRTHLEFENFKKVTSFKNNKASVKKFLIIDKGQKDQLLSFIQSIKSGQPVVDFNSLLYTSEATFKIIESLNENSIKEIDITKYLSLK